MESEETAYFSENRRQVSDFRCPDPWQRISLFVNGDLFPCCSDFGRLEPMGNAYHDTVESAWLSSAAEDLRQLHRAGRWRESDICRRCAANSTAV